MVQGHGLRVVIVASLCLFCGLAARCDSPANSSQAGEHGHDAAVRESFEVAAQAAANKADDICVTVLYDNNTYDKRLKTAWGFSCFIEGLEKTILFDTGGDSRILLSNMHTLGIDPKDVNAVLISHVHYDHFGGLEGFLKQNNALTAYLPKSLPDQMKDVVRRAGAKLVEVHKPLMLCEHAYSTGELGWGLKEQSLVIRTSKGLIVVTGCAHPGVVNVVRKAKELHKDDVYLVLGGFHLCGLGESEIRDVLRGVKSEGVRLAAPCHCSGDAARRAFKEAYGKSFIALGAGFRLEVSGIKKGICVYAGTGAKRACDVEAALDTLGVAYREMDEHAVKNAGLEACSALVMPGGYTNKMVEALGSDGLERIRKFVFAGGGYIGICAGAYMATESVEVPERPAGLAIVAVTNHRKAGRGIKNITIADSNHPVSEGCPKKMRIWYENGSTIEPEASTETIALYEGGGAAIVSSTYGRGTVVIFSPHPEGSIEAGVTPEDLGTLDLLRNAIAFTSREQR